MKGNNREIITILIGLYINICIISFFIVIKVLYKPVQLILFLKQVIMIRIIFFTKFNSYYFVIF